MYSCVSLQFRYAGIWVSASTTHFCGEMWYSGVARGWRGGGQTAPRDTIGPEGVIPEWKWIFCGWIYKDTG